MSISAAVALALGVCAAWPGCTRDGLARMVVALDPVKPICTDLPVEPGAWVDLWRWGGCALRDERPMRKKGPALLLAEADYRLGPVVSPFTGEPVRLRVPTGYVPARPPVVVIDRPGRPSRPPRHPPVDPEVPDLPPIPLPGGIWLLLGALGALGLVQWRRR